MTCAIARVNPKVPSALVNPHQPLKCCNVKLYSAATATQAVTHRRHRCSLSGSPGRGRQSTTFDARAFVHVLARMFGAGDIFMASVTDKSNGGSNGGASPRLHGLDSNPQGAFGPRMWQGFRDAVR